jgi:hypothetical protein
MAPISMRPFQAVGAATVPGLPNTLPFAGHDVQNPAR